MNDFYANALSLANINESEYELICGAIKKNAKLKFILGAGTGLGVIKIIL